ncbi:hypothetical protein DCAR_0933379 [Daucus carota subsp. sativus]|uniref:RRM domain-containing protein n=1 Tax=Daucus carota subsp. sativus TaxID=79200 RepID=A0AAF1BE95_DAUCS|nr:PREDICTED: glycine-rich RNA-binding protein 6, mitochondrial-like [Daucus carota subsp. sativus]WOH13867.1 hypothetical protein DCAR_0933379 [Daucus carota subsp. sativus]
MSSFTRAAASATQAVLRGSQYSARFGYPPSCRVYVSGLSADTTDQKLFDAFERFGRVLHANVVYNHSTGYSKGFGFVTYASVQEAAAGINGMDDQFLDGLVVFAAYAAPKVPQTHPRATT